MIIYPFFTLLYHSTSATIYSNLNSWIFARVEFAALLIEVVVVVIHIDNPAEAAANVPFRRRFGFRHCSRIFLAFSLSLPPLENLRISEQPLGGFLFFLLGTEKGEGTTLFEFLSTLPFVLLLLLPRPSQLHSKRWVLFLVCRIP